jgi:hypothetical protein
MVQKRFIVTFLLPFYAAHAKCNAFVSILRDKSREIFIFCPYRLFQKCLFVYSLQVYLLIPNKSKLLNQHV